ncbi:hypothetical protein GGR21_003482 [Dysgonomonas hofstadii]|uniref:Uncharacterized protein n=1 Tax=Dysgonomonas hofstadii TaxID=637886 RepID=A0A840CYS0_9BACT|nr:hypothetical protein [Dysgonomonas hofstadii]MBB4037562.1 hypothetical protein [Dysgonomonas hofstadii]
MIKRYTLPVYIKGMVFAIILMSFTTSCCVTGYCQVAQDIPQQDEKVKEK